MDAKPLVSVLIRTIARPSLAQSVASALRQTHRPIEIVVVNAGATPLPPLPSQAGVDLRVVEGGPYTRPQAANVALAQARGEWLVFLDDDDAFMPRHVESLLKRLRESDGAQVAYSATACLDAQGRAAGFIDSDFNRLKLLARNYIQIGAALFSAALVAEGYRFDESFDSLQDWDFWIQLAQRTHFVFTSKATNLWFAFTGASGAGVGSNSKPHAIGRLRRRLALKWAGYGAGLAAKVRYHEGVAREAMSKGNRERAQAHLAAAARLVRGPVRKGE
jgi:glycosyltransferase involved in cell wall biosynthesis